MKFSTPLGIFFAVLLHVGFILFGGWLFLKDGTGPGSTQQVELLSEDDIEKQQEKKTEPEAEQIENESEKPPDMAEIMRNLEMPAVADAPALDAASLSAIEAALSGIAGAGGDFGQAMDFASGGKIGGTGKAGSTDDQFDGAFSLAEIDQKPRPVFQAAPVYPSEMRGKNVEGVVTVLFIVDATGRVGSPRVEKSTAAAFEKPALDAVKRWKFEPAVRAGQRVACKMRVPIRFQPS